VSQWGWDVGQLIFLTDGPKWKDSYLFYAFNVFQFIGNIVSYMLDSVPLARYCQKLWAPSFAHVVGEFEDEWDIRNILRYFVFTLPTFLFGLIVAIVVPSVSTLLDFTTACTTPWVTQVFPAVCFFFLHRNRGKLCLHNDSLPMSPLHSFVVGFVGVLSFIMCLNKAVGYLVIDTLRPPMLIGCGSWSIDISH